MDIKEIAEQVSKRIYVEDGLLLSKFISEKFAESLFESYKAELLKEVGEPVFVVFDGPPGPDSGRFIEVETKDRFSVMAGDWENHIPGYWRIGPLFTSDQVSAAIIKATKPLEEEVEWLKTVPMKYRRMAFNAQLQDENNELRTQLAAAQEEIRRLEKIVLSAQNAAIENGAELKSTQDQLAKANQLWQIAQGRCDGLEEKLAKAEQGAMEWQPIETAPKETEVFIGRFIDGKFMFGKSVLFYEQGNEFEGEFYRGWFWSIDDVCESVAECPTHWMPLPKPPAIDAAILSQGEQK